MTNQQFGPLPDLQTRARSVAKDFLQSVVVVDDQADLGGQGVLLGPTTSDDAFEVPSGEWAPAGDTGRTSGGLRRKASRLRPPQIAEVVSQVPEQSLDASALVDGFAEQGLVCAIIRPRPGESPVDRTVLAARRADIVILDWELYGDDGEVALRIVHRLVHERAEARPGGRLRLIAFYSGVPALRQIASRVETALSHARGALPFEADGEFILRAGAIRIVVYAKSPNRLGAADEALRDRVVAVEELPARLIDEFAAMATGLVQHVALASLAALRRNMHRLLARLSSDLDPAYLWHRATLTRPADAEEHLVELVAGELRSILEDERVGELANIDSISGWIDRDGRPDFGPAFGENSSRSREDVLALLAQGAAGKSDVNKEVRDNFKKMAVERTPHRNQAIAAFATTPATALRSNESFAVLMSLRTRYEHPPPRLELGTILERGAGRSRTWWLCVQPRCDSVRLGGRTAFPLLPLRSVGTNEKFDLLLPNGQGGYSRFRLCTKPADLDKQIFAVHPAGGDTVMAEPLGNSFVFRSARYRYSWVADLKPEHAQRVAQQLASEFSRVGLNESEWLRLWAAKG